MLAQQHGLALITEKLQNQRLEEPAAATSAALSSAVATSPSALCSKLPSVNQEPYVLSDHTLQPQTLSVEGKNVWTLSPYSQGCPPSSLPLTPSSRGSIGATTTHPTVKDQQLAPPTSLCRHRKLRHYCTVCDSAPGTPSAPPKKKHCRSLSVPPDGPSSGSFFPSGKDTSSSPITRFSIGTAGYGHSSHHHPHHHHHHHYHSSSSSSSHHGPKIWKPIAVVPLRCSGGSSNNNNSSSSSCSGGGGGSSHHATALSTTTDNNNSSSCRSSGQSKERLTANIVSHSGVYNNDDDDNNNNNSSSSSIIATSVSSRSDNAQQHHHHHPSTRLGSCLSSSNLFKFKLVPPPSFSSSGSFDSGHFTTSDLQTPPTSPIPQPRPASATSDVSHSSAGWCDFSPMRSRVRILQNRSLSCEDKISGFSGCSYCSTTTTSMPCVYNCSSGADFTFGGSGISSSGGCGHSGALGGGSGSGCCPHHGAGNSSISSSEVIPRCHSQPCVLHYRRLGKKRRRDCDRPTLNFNKMTETAYTQSHRRSDPWSRLSQETDMSLWQSQQGFSHASISSHHQSPFVLNPIASSPLDSAELLMSKHLQAQQPPTPSALAPDRPPVTCKPVGLPGDSMDRRTLGFTPAECHSEDGQRMSGKDDDDDDDDEEEEEEEEEEDEDSRNCNCHDSSREPDSIGFFPMGDLDLEQIETH